MECLLLVDEITVVDTMGSADLYFGDGYFGRLVVESFGGFGQGLHSLLLLIVQALTESRKDRSHFATLKHSQVLVLVAPLVASDHIAHVSVDRIGLDGQKDRAAPIFAMLADERVLPVDSHWPCRLECARQSFPSIFHTLYAPSSNPNHYCYGYCKGRWLMFRGVLV